MKRRDVIRRAYNYNWTHVRGERVSAPLILLAQKERVHRDRERPSLSLDSRFEVRIP